MQMLDTGCSGRRAKTDARAADLLPLADQLGVTIEELIDTRAPRGAGKRDPKGKVEQQLERVTALPKAQQRFVMQMIDTVLQRRAD